VIEMAGWDNATTVPVGVVDERVDHLLRVTENALARAIGVAHEDRRLGDICAEIEDEARRSDFLLCANLSGTALDEKCTKNRKFELRQARNRPRLRPGMTLAIEPMINMGTSEVRLLDDGWTVRTADGCPQRISNTRS